MPAKKPEPWTGVRSSMYYGQVCSQGARVGWAADENAFMFEWDDGQPGEDCLRVNVWTPGLNDNGKRTVMVWIHGGGYSASAANVGMLDLVASLEWVRDNITNFGGDPANVMIFGQSGGGGKVGVLMAMPAAKGLFPIHPMFVLLICAPQPMPDPRHRL